jgi:hypothetical protein
MQLRVHWYHRERDKVFILLIAIKKKLVPVWPYILHIYNIINTTCFTMLIVRLFTAQNTIHLEFNFSLLISNKINYDHDWFATSGNPFCFFKLFLQTEKFVIFFKYIFRHRFIYTLRQKLSIYFYRYIFLHQYC